MWVVSSNYVSGEVIFYGEIYKTRNFITYLNI